MYGSIPALNIFIISFTLLYDYFRWKETVLRGSEAETKVILEFRACFWKAKCTWYAVWYADIIYQKIALENDAPYQPDILKAFFVSTSLLIIKLGKVSIINYSEKLIGIAPKK